MLAAAVTRRLAIDKGEARRTRYMLARLRHFLDPDYEAGQEPLTGAE